MHNNFTIDRTPKPSKAFYTVTEIAVQWARSEGAKSANDSRIGHYSRIILESIVKGDLPVSETQEILSTASENSKTTVLPSLSSTVSLQDLKRWFSDHFPTAKPIFLTKS